jgi:hypothetical protein
MRRVWVVRALARMALTVAVVLAIAAAASALLALVRGGGFVDDLQTMTLLVGALLVVMGTAGGGLSRAADASARGAMIGRVPGIPSWAESQSNEPQVSGGATLVVSGLALIVLGLVLG